MIAHYEYQQGSVEWLEAHCGIPTASEWDNLVTSKWEIRAGEMPKTYLARKLAEAWTGPLLGFNSFQTEQGHILEGEALPWLEFEYGWKLQRPGFCTTDDGKLGCSPDALLDDGGVEIKCPEAPTHIKYLLKGELPPDYAAQVHGCMLVTGAPWWKFVSYRRRLPPFVLHVRREEGIQERLREALSLFQSTFDQSMSYLIDLNGGPPPKRIPMVFSDEISRGRQYKDEMGITP